MRHRMYSFGGSGRNGAARCQPLVRKAHAIRDRSIARRGLIAARAESLRSSPNQLPSVVGFCSWLGLCNRTPSDALHRRDPAAGQSGGTGCLTGPMSSIL